MVLIISSARDSSFHNDTDHRPPRQPWARSTRGRFWMSARLID